MGGNASKIATEYLRVDPLKDNHNLDPTESTSCSGDDNDQTTQEMIIQADGHLAQEDYAEAFDRYKQVLQIRKSRLGEKHSLVADAHADLARLCAVGGHIESAWRYFKHAVRIRCEVCGDNSQEVADVYDQCGSVLRELGQFQQAIIQHTIALQIQEQVAAQDAKALSRIATIHRNIGSCHISLREWERAAQHLNLALSGFKRAEGNQAQEIVQCCMSFGTLCKAQQQWDKALEHYIRAERVCLQSVGELHQLTYKVYKMLKKCYKALGQNNKAKDYKAKASNLRESLCEPSQAEQCALKQKKEVNQDELAETTTDNGTGTSGFFSAKSWEVPTVDAVEGLEVSVFAGTSTATCKAETDPSSVKTSHKRLQRKNSKLGASKSVGKKKRVVRFKLRRISSAEGEKKKHH